MCVLHEWYGCEEEEGKRMPKVIMKVHMKLSISVPQCLGVAVGVVLLIVAVHVRNSSYLL